MKEAVLFYSLSGVTKTVAIKIAEIRSCDLLEIKPVEPYTRKTAFSKGVVDTKKGINIEIEELKVLDDYQRIYLGTPIWAFGFAAPLNTIFAQGVLNGKEVILFSTSAGLAGSKSLDSIKNKLTGAKIIGGKNFSVGELKKSNAVTDWIESINR